MKFTVLQTELAKSLSTASRFASTRAQLPVLTNIAVEARKNGVDIKATNLETSISYHIGAKVSEEGDIAVPARTITELISNLSGEQIEFSAENENLKIAAPDFSARVTGMNTADFPHVPKSVAKPLIKLPGEKFSSAINQVLFSVSRDDTRPVLTGVLFLFSKNQLTMVGSDGFRLSQVSLALPEEVDEQKTILPKGILAEVTRVLGQEGEVSVSVDEEEAQALFGVAGVTLGSRVIEGDFPPFEKIIPKTKNTTVFVSKEELTRAVKVSAVFAREAANVVKLSVGKDTLSISAESATSGEQEMAIPARVEGEAVEILFNYRFIEEFLGVEGIKEIQIDLIDSASPGVFRDTKNKNFFHLIMPVRPQG